MFWIPSLLVLLLDVLTIAHLVKYHRYDRTLVLWIILVILLPLLGPILYLLLGPEPRPRLL